MPGLSGWVRAEMIIKSLTARNCKHLLQSAVVEKHHNNFRIPYCFCIDSAYVKFFGHNLKFRHDAMSLVAELLV